MRHGGALLLVFILAFSGVYLLMADSKDAGVEAINGVLDLRQANGALSRLIPLRGEWTFRKWEDTAYAAPVTVLVPNSWEDLEVNGKPLGPKAIGRYELKLLLNLPKPNSVPPDKRLPPGLGPERRPGDAPPGLGPGGSQPGGPPPGSGVSLFGPPALLIASSFGSAYSLRINGTPPLANDGKIDFRRQTSTAGYSHSNVRVPKGNGDTITLYLDVANHHHHLGGLTVAPSLGYHKTVDRYVFWWTFPALFVGSLLFGFSLFCLGLMLVFRGRKLLRYAALFCIAGVVRLLFSDSMPISYLSTDLPWNLVLSLRFLTFPYLCYFIGLYLLELLPGRGNERFRYFLSGGVGLITLLVIVLPPFHKSYVLYGTQVYIVATAAIGVYLLWRDRKIEQAEVTIIRFTAALALAFVAGEFLKFYGSYFLPGMQTYGILVISGGMALIVLRDVMRLNTERTVLMHNLQTANEELSGFARSLEGKVELRTQELAERNEELEALQRFRRRTNAMIIHDLKNPLQVILSQARVGRGTDGRIETAGRRMLLMIQNLLDVDRAEQTKLTVRTERFPLRDLVVDAVDRQRGLTAEKSISVTVDLPLTELIVSDRNLTERAIDNVLHNAVKYTPVNGIIRLFTEAQDGFVALYCDDSGPGVPEELRSQIFADYASDRAQPDAYGLGLSFVRIALEAVGGKVTVESPESGSGGRFVLFFPAVVAPTTTQPALSLADQQALGPYLERLRGIPHYQATQIEGLLGQIPDTGNLLAWKQALREAMYAGDEETYRGLVE